MVGSSNTNTASSCARPISLASFRRCASPPDQRRRGLAQREVAQAQLVQRVQAGARLLQAGRGRARLVHGHGHELGQRAAGILAALGGAVDAGGFRGVARASAHGAGDVHVGQELHVQADGARAVAFGAAQLPRVVGEVARLQPGCLGVGRARRRRDAARRARRSRWPRYERTFEPMGVASMRFARSMPAASMRLTWEGSFALLAFATSAGMRLSSTSVVLPEPDTPVTAVRRPRGMATSSGFTVCSASVASSMLPWANTSAAGTRSRTRTVSSPERKPPISEAGFRLYLGKRPLRDDPPAVSARARPHLHEPVCGGQDARVVVHHDHRVAVGEQIAHHLDEPVDVGGVQADGRLVQHVQHAGGSVAHGAGQLHALALSGGQRGAPRDRARDSPAPNRRGGAPCAGTTRRCCAPSGASRARDHRAPASVQATSSSRVFADASARSMPATCGRRASGERRVPWQTGQTPCLRKRAHAPQALLVLHLRQRVLHGCRRRCSR